MLWAFRDHLTGLASVLWPILAGGTLVGFRYEIRDLLRRLKHFGKEGMVFGEEQISAQILAVPVSDALNDVAPGEERFSSIENRVAFLRTELQNRFSDDKMKREYILMLRLAEAQQIRDFQTTWMIIYLSQLELFTKLLQ